MALIIPLPEQALLRQLFDYDPISGRLRWRGKASRKHLPGLDAGALHHTGYVQVRVSGRIYLAARLIWKIQTGTDPAAEVDHRNGVRSDNRWANLREATSSQQKMNRRVRNDHRGVSYIAARGRYTAQIKVQGVVEFLGQYASPEEACAAYRARSAVLFGTFAKPGCCACR